MTGSAEILLVFPFRSLTCQTSSRSRGHRSSYQSSLRTLYSHDFRHRNHILLFCSHLPLRQAMRAGRLFIGPERYHCRPRLQLPLRSPRKCLSLLARSKVVPRHAFRLGADVTMAIDCCSCSGSLAEAAAGSIESRRGRRHCCGGDCGGQPWRRR